MAKAFAKEAGLTFFKVSGSKINSGLVAQQFGASKNKLYSLLEAAAKYSKQKKRRVVVFIDEIDMMDSDAKLAGMSLSDLSGGGVGGTEFKDIMDGDDHEKAGRLEEKYFIGEPKGDDLKAIIDIYVKKHKEKIPDNLEPELAEKIFEKIRNKGFVGATINSMFENLDFSRKKLNKKKNSDKRENDWEVFERAIEQTIEIEETSKKKRNNIFEYL
ncbi:10786_t:CDS:2 [Paraglomus occultum]|uniref:10786_t:CDS:1 n=1 Tax=Paraglomus occultum TaxID=144539 RepID=A0A9N9FHZ0_9GLOM|nr:10786_t:CDS:2 [Paraglomus occultum]